MCWTRETGVIPAALAGLLLGMEGARCTNDLIRDLHCYSHDDPDTGADDKMVGEQAKTFG